MKKELTDRHAVVGEITFYVANILESILPDILSDESWWKLLSFQKLRVYPDHESFLVVTPVEYSNPAAFGETFEAPPQKIVIEILARRSLERVDLASLRIHSRHNMLDRSVFSGCIHCLKDEQHGPAILCVEHVL